MNERIEELLEQTGIHLDDNGDIIWSKTRYNSEVEKFAMLIIRECIDICEQTHDTSNGKMRCANDDESIRIIKERFGIEL